MQPNHKLANMLKKKAERDTRVLHILAANPEAPYEAMGFHAQQAVEKLMKAVLAINGLHYPKIHDIWRLMDIIQEHGIPFPEDLAEVRRLSPFAVDYRYDDMLPGEEIATAPVLFLEWVEKMHAWAQEHLTIK